MTTEHIRAQAPSFEHLLDQFTLAFEPFQTVAELLAALDRAADSEPLEVPEPPIVPLWEEPDWTTAPIPIEDPDNSVCLSVYVDDLTYKAEAEAVADAGWPQLADMEVNPTSLPPDFQALAAMRAWALVWRAECRMFGRDTEFARCCLRCALGWRAIGRRPACHYTQKSDI